MPVVSAGHSGATVACGMFIMGRLPGVERPALAALLPTEKNPVVVLDAGANVDCGPIIFSSSASWATPSRVTCWAMRPRVSAC